MGDGSLDLIKLCTCHLLHQMVVTGQHFIKADGQPPTVSLGLIEDTWAQFQPAVPLIAEVIY